MGFIILEGNSLYMFLILLILMFLISLGSLICAILTDRKIYYLDSLLAQERNNVKFLNRENLRLKIKCGELGSDEE